MCDKTKKIETPSLYLLAANADLLKAAIAGNEQLGRMIGVQVAVDWTQFGTGVFQFVLGKLRKDPAQGEWLNYFPIHKATNTLIGSGGYKGKPTEDGTVEIGYEIAPAFRNLGLATEMATALVENAFLSPLVISVTAHTLAQANPSTRVLEKCQFIKTEELVDPDDGPIWTWVRHK